MLRRALGLVAFEPTWHAMQAFTRTREDTAPDQLWLVQHPPVYTLGLAGRREHVLAPGAIPVVACDRGGQVTYHGPGQAIVYTLLDLRRRRLGVRDLVRRLEQATLDVVHSYGLAAHRREGMPGAYVDDAKIAAIGLRVARGCTYHGIALNADLDLSPFGRIDPCGYPGLASTSLAAAGVRDSIDAVHHHLADAIDRVLA